MKLTLTREQIPLARDAMRALRVEAVRTDLPEVQGGARKLPGHDEWAHGGASKEIDLRWADALEAAITEAEHPMQVITLAKPGDADERAFWRAVFTEVHSGDKRDPTTAADQADEALDRYRKAFCAGMPSDQKGVER